MGGPNRGRLTVGDRMRGKKKQLLTLLAAVAIIVYIVLPAIALLGLH